MQGNTGQPAAQEEAAAPDISKKVEQQWENKKAAIEFLESTVEQKLPVENSLWKSLRDGIFLCKLLNKLRPGSIPRISTKPLPFLQMENINNFLSAAQRLGVPSAELFQTVDLFEGKGMQQVVVTILAISRIVAGIQPSKKGITDYDIYKDGVILEPPSDIAPHPPVTKPPVTKQASTPVIESRQRSNTTALSGARGTLETAGKAKSAEALLPADHVDRRSLRVGKHSRSRSDYCREVDRLSIESSTLGHYQLGNCIGRGQYGAVYKALNMESGLYYLVYGGGRCEEKLNRVFWHNFAGRVVAVKRIPMVDQDADGLKELFKEVDLLKSLSHPNIVRYEGFIQQGGHLNIILEFIEGGSLISLMKTFGPLPEKLAVNYVEKMLEGLQYLHERGVCANILTTKDGNIKLSDFGVSEQLNGMDRAQSVAGTPYWMAPEVIELVGTSTLSDIWSLGCTIIEMLTMKPPYIDLIPMTALFRIVEDDSPPLPEGLSGELTDFLQKCFQKDLNKRWTSAELLQHDWIRKNIKDPKKAAESAKLLEISTRHIQEFAPHSVDFSPRTSPGSTVALGVMGTRVG
ncbi:hypothetical protein HDV00_007080 [Rhizophlyctis rosea]|nr:hypothetical protein HDV00_007080 [Rhizophlyctis rosea]